MKKHGSEDFGCIVALLLVALCILYSVVVAMDAHGQEPVQAQIERALRARLQIWTRPSGRPVYVRHCRDAHGGCEARTRRLSELFVQAGHAHRVDPWLLAAIAVRESGTNPNAVGGRGEFGVMQLHPGSRRGREASLRCAGAPGTCPAEDVDVAAALVRVGIDRCGTEATALGLYNAGRCGETTYSRGVLAMRAVLVAHGVAQEAE